MLPSEGRAAIWTIRVAWLGLPLVTGQVLGDALAGTSRPVQLVASVGLWCAWAAILLATLVPRIATLTPLRIATPAALAAVAAGVARDGGTLWWQIASLSWSGLIAVVAFLPAAAVGFVNGSSYGDEVRLPLRVPGPLLLGPIPIAWVVVIAGLASGPLLLAARLWVAAGVALLMGLPAAMWGARVLHRLAQRWAVFVPGGLVLHDPLTLVDPVLLRRGALVWLGPAPSRTSALDLTAGALGLALEARLERPVNLVLARPGKAGRGRAGEAVAAQAVMFTPTRPGAFLTTARARRLAVARTARQRGSTAQR
jgi:hypothetical protein